MRANRQPVTVDVIRAAHRARHKEIRARLREFRELWERGSDQRLWEELVFCIFTAGASARMGLRAIAAVRPLLKTGAREEMTRALSKSPAYRFPNARPDYIVKTRQFLQRSFGMRLREQLASFDDPLTRRDWLAREPHIKGLGYKEASHFLRNIGFRGYGILDKHVLRCLAEVGVVGSAQPPAGRSQYLETEQRMRRFAKEVSIDFDELDLVLWSMKTGEVLR